ncbi:hypothetical protein EOM82_08430 [bacterium]|nr:hypothetical protein [bacterium]
MERVFKKQPPFTNSDNASDKGFKDTLLWISLLNFFGEQKNINEVIFFTNDKDGFIKQIPELEKEFISVTGTKISIKKNIYYQEIIGKKDEHQNISDLSVNTMLKENISKLTESINKCIRNLTTTLTQNIYGEDYYQETFSIDRYFDNNDVAQFFYYLPTLLDSHIFESSLNATIIFNNVDNVKNLASIDMDILYELNNLHEDIKQKYPNYIVQFYNAICAGINNNYVPAKVAEVLPF